MRTEQDLRAALGVRENLAPAPDTVLADVRQIAAQHRRRRATGTAAAVILVVAAVIAVPVLLVQGRPTDPGPAPLPNPPVGAATPSPTAAPVDPGAARPPFAFTIAPVSIGGFEVRPSSVSPDQQGAIIMAAGGTGPVADLVVYSPGSPAVPVPYPPHAEPVQVDGAPGWYNASESALGWEYAPEAFAVISRHDEAPLAKDILLELAEGVRFVEPYAAKVPYRLDYLPDDLTPFNVAQSTGPASEYQSVVQLESRNADRPRVMDITIVESRPTGNSPWYGYADWDWNPVTIAGRSGRCADLVDGRRCEIDFGEFIFSVGSGNLVPDELDRLVGGMRFATVGDPATWYDITTAIPGL